VERFEESGHEILFTSSEVKKFVSATPVMTSKQASTARKATMLNQPIPVSALPSTKCSMKYPYFLIKDTLNLMVMDALRKRSGFCCVLKITGNLFENNY
jgi:hypothetical protein